MRVMRVGLLRALVAVTLGTVVVGCGTSLAGAGRPASSGADGSGSSTTSTPTPTGTPSGTALSTEVPLAAEPTPTTGATREPLTELPEVDVAIGRWLEARRIGNQMPSPADADPAYTYKVVDPTGPITDNPGRTLTTAQVSALQRIGGLQAGFGAGRAVADSSSTMIFLVLDFATEAQAAAAAAAIPVSRPKTVAGSSTTPGVTVAAGTDVGISWVDVATAVGTRVHHVYLNLPEGGQPQAAAEAALAFLVDEMQDFRSTAPEARLKLPDDPDSLVSHTIGGHTVDQAGWYTARGGLHYVFDHARSATTWANAGVDLVVWGAVSVYRAADGPRAKLLQADFLGEAASEGGYTEIELPGLPPAVTCMDTGRNAVSCAGVVGRHVFRYDWDDEEQAVRLAQKQIDLLEQL